MTTRRPDYGNARPEDVARALMQMRNAAKAKAPAPAKKSNT